MSSFQNLRRTLHLFPSSKQNFYSTRVNERDKSVHVESTGASTVNRQNTTTCSSSDDSSSRVSSTGHNLLPVILPPASSLLPMSYKDVQDILARGSAQRFTPENDFISKAVRSVSLTCDDILVDPFGASNSCNHDQSVKERIPVEIVSPKPSTSHYFKDFRVSPWGLQSFKSSEELGKSSCDSLDNSLGHNISLRDAVIPDVHTVLFSATDSLWNKSSSKDSGPSSDQMQQAREKLEKHVLTLFSSTSTDYSILHKNIVLENNLYGANKICRGTGAYAFELLKMRLRINLQSSSSSMEIVNITSLEQNGIIRIHWRLRQVPQSKAFTFWKIYKPKDDKGMEWLEAFSYFHVGTDGLVHKHRIDRTLPDEQREPSKLTEKLQGLLNPAKPLIN